MLQGEQNKTNGKPQILDPILLDPPLGSGLMESVTQPDPTPPPSTWDLPSGYGRTLVRLMVRDPFWLHAYWEVSPQDQHLGLENPGSVLSIRLLSLDDPNPQKVWEVPGASNWYVNVPQPDRDYVVELGYQLPDGRFLLLARSNRVHPPRAGLSPVLDEEWMTIHSLYSQRVYPWQAGTSPGLAQMGAMGSGHLFSDVSSPMGASPAGWAEEAPFFLEVGTELIVYGRTQPDAHLTIQGEKVQLRPDGTFSLRMTLPDGCRILPISARSADGVHTRKTTPIITRETRQ